MKNRNKTQSSPAKQKSSVARVWNLLERQAGGSAGDKRMGGGQAEGGDRRYSVTA